MSLLLSTTIPNGADVRLEVGPFLVRVRTDLPEVIEHLNRVYADFPVAAADGSHFDIVLIGRRDLRRWVRRQVLFSADGASPFLPLPRELAGPFLDWGLNWCVGQTAHRWLALHAAVVERNGGAMVMPAPPGSGKSTLCTALAFSGWRFFSDEFALVDPDTARVRPLPRPISLKNRSIDIVRARFPGVTTTTERRDMEGERFVHLRPPADSVREAHRDAPVRWIMFPKYSAGATTRLERLSRAECLMELADQSFNYNYVGNRGFNRLCDLVRHADCYRLTYSDLDDVLERLKAMAGG